MKTPKRINLVFVNSVDDFACKKFRLLLVSHFARRRNNPACSADVLRINFLAFSMGMVRTGVSGFGGALAGGGVRVMIVSFSIGKQPSLY